MARSDAASLKVLGDAELVAEILDGNEGAFNELYRRYYPRMVYFVCGIVKDADRAEDLVQEGFLRAYRHLVGFDRAKKFSTWIYTICGNLAKNEIRGRKRAKTVFFNQFPQDEERLLPQLEAVGWQPDQVFRRSQIEGAVRDATKKLSDEHRMVFILREFHGKSYEEISGIIGVKIGTVKSRLNRARTNFAEIIELLVA